MSIPNCTNFSQYCSIEDSFYAYIPSLAANLAFVAIFGLSLLLHLGQGLWWWKPWKGFAIAMVVGNVAEVVGYVGRIMNYNNPFDQNGFLVQICCITIAPAFLSAGVYFCLGTIVRICDPSISRIPPRFYAYIFIPCDFISLVLQAIGGAMASIATTNQQSPDQGDNVMIAGVSFQVFTLSIFILLSGDYALRVRRSNWATETERKSMRLASGKFLSVVVKMNKKLGLERWSAVDMNVVESRGVDRTRWSRRETHLFRAFLWALGISTVAIFIRCVYRVVEMSFGWSGIIIANEHLFIGFEGVCISVAVLILNVFHPGHCLKKLNINEDGAALDNIYLRHNSDAGNASSESTHTIEELKRKSRFNRFREVSKVTTTAKSLHYHDHLENYDPLEKECDEETMKRPVSLADILKESRVNDPTASREGWVGQSLRDTITRDSFSKEKKSMDVGNMRRGISLRHRISLEELSVDTESFHTGLSE